MHIPGFLTQETEVHPYFYYIKTGDFKVIQLTYKCKVSLLIKACCIDLQDAILAYGNGYNHLFGRSRAIVANDSIHLMQYIFQSKKNRHPLKKVLNPE